VFYRESRNPIIVFRVSLDVQRVEYEHSSKNGKRWRAAIGYALSAVLLVLILGSVDLDTTLEHMARVPAWAVLATAIIGYLSIPLRVAQWRWLLGWPTSVSNRRAFQALCVGYLGNAVLPMRGGEFVKSYLLARMSGLRLDRVLATVVVERVQDVLPILWVAALAACVIPVSGDLRLDTGVLNSEAIVLTADELRRFLRTLGITSIIASGVLLLVLVRTKQFAVLIRGLVANVSRLSVLRGVWARIESAFETVSNPRALLGSQCIALLCWVLFVLAPIPLLIAFSLDIKQALITAIAVTGLATFAHLIPSAPGGVGTFDALSLFAVLVCNPDMGVEQAAAFTFVAHAIGVFAPALPGIVLLPRSWKQLQEARTYQEAIADVPDPL
jgi:glycosyltransferase 2 family protein